MADPAVSAEERDELWKAEEPEKEPLAPIETEGKTEAEINLANATRAKELDEETKRI